MTRRPLKMAFIENMKGRKESFRKRIKGMIKKIHELAVLCGVDACAIILSPFGVEPTVWPKDPSEFDRVMSKFKEQPDIEKNRHRLDQQGYMQQTIMKLHHQLLKLQITNCRKTAKCVLAQVFTPGIVLESRQLDDLRHVDWAISFTLREISQRASILRQCSQNPPNPRVTKTPAAETSYITNNQVPGPSVGAFSNTPMNTNQNQNPTAAAGNMNVDANKEPDTNLRLSSW